MRIWPFGKVEHRVNMPDGREPTRMTTINYKSAFYFLAGCVVGCGVEG